MSLGLRVQPVVLQGELVRLEPMSQDHAQGLYNRGRTATDWQYLPRACFVDLADARQWVAEALEAPDQLPFVIIERGKNKVVGSTRYLNIRPAHRSLEIGWTWLGQEWQRTGVNTEVKLLLLTHAWSSWAACGWSSRPMPATCARNGRWSVSAPPVRG